MSRIFHFRAAPALAAVALCVALTPRAATALGPQTIAAQGFLQSGTGQPVADGDYGMTVKFYASESAPQALYFDVAPAVKVKGGVFTVAIGTVKPLDFSAFKAGGALWVGVSVGSDPELPRSPLASVPYALRSDIAGGVQCTGCITANELDPAVLEPFAKAASLAKVAATGNYQDLTNKVDLKPYALSADLAQVATSGAYKDLSGKPDLAPYALAASLATVAQSGKYADLSGGPDLTPYAKVDAANTFAKAQKLDGGGLLGANLDFNKTVALNMRIHSADTAPATCDASMVGLMYYNTKLGQLLLCNGKAFKLVAIVGDIGGQDNPAPSCLELQKQNPQAKTGMYWIKPAGTAYQCLCDMDTAGGGWTVVAYAKDEVYSNPPPPIGNGSGAWQTWINMDWKSNSSYYLPLVTFDALTTGASSVLQMSKDANGAVVAMSRLDGYDYDAPTNKSLIASCTNIVGAPCGSSYTWIKFPPKFDGYGQNFPCNSGGTVIWNYHNESNCASDSGLFRYDGSTTAKPQWLGVYTKAANENFIMVR